MRPPNVGRAVNLKFVIDAPSLLGVPVSLDQHQGPRRHGAAQLILFQQLDQLTEPNWILEARPSIVASSVEV